MTTTVTTHAQSFLDGAQDVNQPGRYKLIAGLVQDCSSVLDVGCGDGILRGFLPDISDYVGIDADDGAIRQARATYPKTGFFASTAETYNPGKPFDAVVLNEMLYYLNNPEAVLRKYSKTGKSLIVSVLERDTPFWQTNKNADALKIARQFLSDRIRCEYRVMENGKTRVVLWA